MPFFTLNVAVMQALMSEERDMLDSNSVEAVSFAGKQT
jgi:hypothetical protein